MKTNQVYHETNLETMSRMPDGFCDLIITSPPYAEARKSTYGGICADDYVEWFKPIASEMYRVLSDHGSFILNIGDNTIDGETHLYTFEIPIVLKREIGFKFIDPLIWHKKTAPPGRFKNRFKDSWEFCYHFTKTFDITFNPYEVAEPTTQVSIDLSLRHKDTHEMKSLSGSGFTNPNGNLQRRIRNNQSGFGTNDERLSGLEMALPGNVLWMAGETTNVGHPAPYPERLVEFFIKAFSNEDDLIYDPFGGSGTTGVVALRAGRKFIMSELNPEYVKIAERRLYPHLNNLFT